MNHFIKRAALLSMAFIFATFGQSAFAQSTESMEPDEQRLPQPAPMTCDKLDEDQLKIADAIDRKNAFFDEALFECEADWFENEQTVAKFLAKLGQESFRRYEELPKGQMAIKLRQINSYQYGDYRLSRIDCNFADAIDRSDADAKLGTFLLASKNRWSKKHNGKWIMQLSAADCQFIFDLFEKSNPENIKERVPYDLNGTIILHGGSSLTEYVSFGGYWHLYHRNSAPSVPDDETANAEDNLDFILNYLRQRAQETGRKSSIK